MVATLDVEPRGSIAGLEGELAAGAALLVTMVCGEACPVVPGLRRVARRSMLATTSVVSGALRASSYASRASAVLELRGRHTPPSSLRTQVMAPVLVWYTRFIWVALSLHGNTSIGRDGTREARGLVASEAVLEALERCYRGNGYETPRDVGGTLTIRRGVGQG